jgi:pilus assembly protein CpaE
MLAGLGSVLLAETCERYEQAEKAAAAHMPQLVLVSLDGDTETAIGTISRLAQSHPGLALLPASQHREGEVILRLMRAGARELLPLPVPVQDLIEAIERLVPSRLESGGGPVGSQLIAITGAMGGVGSTTTAVHLAAALAKTPDLSVALGDFDMLLGTIDTYLDLVSDRTVLEVAQAVDRLDLTLLRRSLTKYTTGVHVLPRPMSIEDVPRLEADALRQVISLLKAAFPVVILDTSKGLQLWDLVALELADTIVLVVQFNVACLRNTARLLQLYRQNEGMLDRVRILSNRTGSRMCEISRKKAEEILGLPVTYDVPDSKWELHSAAERGVPLETVAPGSRVHKAFVDMSRSFLEERGAASAESSKPKRTGLGRIAAMFV